MKKLLAIIRAYSANALEYRGDILLYSFSYAAQPVVYLLVWLAVSASSKSLAMTSSEFVQYYLWLLVVQIWVSAWASRDISYAVRLGRLSQYLVKPINYINFQIGENLSEKFLKTGFTIPVLIILIVTLKPTWPILTTIGWLTFIWAWLLAGVVYFLTDICVGLLAFWFEETSAIDDIYNVIHSIFSGILIPLILMPPFVRTLAVFLPFRYSLSFPMEILLQKLTIPEQITGLILQIIFVVLLFFLYHYLWKQGIKKYSAVGN